MCNLNNAFSFRGFALNTVTRTGRQGGGPVISGCELSTIEHDGVEIRQFTEPLALVDGIDIGGVWRGGRHVAMTGTIYGATRALAFSALDTLRGLLLPVSGTFGLYALALTEGTLMVRPNGIRVVYDRHMYGGNDAEPLAISWSTTFYAPNPNWA